jgi:dihydrolipoamide dehydrogenase
MKKHSVLVVGAGTGADIAAFAAERGLSTALVEEGPLGGTCHNRGCIPSKMLIHSADVADTINNSEKFGIKAKIEAIDFPSIVNRVFGQIDKESKEMEEAAHETENITLYKARGKFVSPKVMRVGDEEITAEKIFIVGGTRPSVPPINGLDKIKYLTSNEALRLTKQPKDLVIIGGGYIAAELTHFFSSLGTEVTVLVRGTRLLDREDSEIAGWFTKEVSKKWNILFKTEAEEFFPDGEGIKIKLKDGKLVSSDQVLLATGRVPNGDILDLKAGGLELDERGNLKINDYLETNLEGVWGLGDIVGILPLKHTANHQAGYAIKNAFLDKREKVDYRVIPHAVFSSPQVAGVGKTEEELKKLGISYKVGSREYKETAMGQALQENGLVKVLVGEDNTILGAHIIGPDASTLIHELVVAMGTSGKVSAIEDAVYAHPALSEVVQRAFWKIE